MFSDEQNFILLKGASLPFASGFGLCVCFALLVKCSAYARNRSNSNLSRTYFKFFFFLSSIPVLSVRSVIDYIWYIILFFSLAVYHKISTYEFIVSSREQRSEASDVEAGTDKPSSCKQSNKKMFKVGLQQSDFQFVSSLTKHIMCHRPSRDN